MSILFRIIRFSSQFFHNMCKEKKALEKNQTWEIVELFKGKRSIKCKWVFTIKYKMDGTLERHKVKLVAKRYTHTYGIDYQETFASKYYSCIIFGNYS